MLVCECPTHPLAQPSFTWFWESNYFSNGILKDIVLSRGDKLAWWLFEQHCTLVGMASSTQLKRKVTGVRLPGT
eukprot:scaffold154950_cov22-Tisochrysis_lutea.AAC.1